jgi:alpha-L-rhamnosidase
MQWGFQTLAGIDTDGPGYQRIIISPNPPSPGATGEPKPIDWVKAHYESIHGRIASEWRANGASFELLTTIPANTTATVFLPAKDAASVTEGGRPLAEVEGVKFIRTEPGRVVLAVESGGYQFRSTR